MATGDWEKIEFEIDDVDLDQAKVFFGDYTIIFDMYASCCESFGVKFQDGDHEIDIDSVKVYSDHHYSDVRRAIPYFKNLEQCEIDLEKDECGGGTFVFEFDNNRKISFYNFHNGYYPHTVSINHNDKQIFLSYI